MKRLLWIFFIVCFSCVAQAHEDPSGEIYPYVSVENDRFIVYYMVSKPTIAVGEGCCDYYQVAYDKEGNRIGAPQRAPKEKLRSYRIWSVSDIDAVLPEKLRGVTLKDGEDFLVIPTPEWRSKPYLLIKRGDKFKKERIDWGNRDRFIVHDALSVENNIVVLLTEIEPNDFLSNDFELLSINRQTRKIERYLTAGVPGRLMWTVTSSNLLQYGGRVFLAWGERYIDGLRLNLSSWKTADAYFSKELISGPVNWNTHLSMAQIDGVGLIAYHSAEDGYHNSVVKTLRVDLKRHLKEFR